MELLELGARTMGTFVQRFGGDPDPDPRRILWHLRVAACATLELAIEHPAGGPLEQRWVELMDRARLLLSPRHDPDAVFGLMFDLGRWYRDLALVHALSQRMPAQAGSDRVN